ncbi:hypothetical protein M758_2G121700 [Ceratodon purpureus]|nr:hypothetical protein M758_2G121700 [Ceratodon purpureus]
MHIDMHLNHRNFSPSSSSEHSSAKYHLLSLPIYRFAIQMRRTIFSYKISNKRFRQYRDFTCQGHLIPEREARKDSMEDNRRRVTQRDEEMGMNSLSNPRVCTCTPPSRTCHPQR